MTSTSAGTSLYRLYDANGQLLYVGVTDGPVPDRLAAHRRTVWWAQVDSFAVDHHPTRQKALDAERLAIRTEQPLHNIRSVTSDDIREMQQERGRVAQQGYQIRMRVLNARLSAGVPYAEAVQDACAADRAHKAASGLFLSLKGK
jgi:hypothetical protein